MKILLDNCVDTRARSFFDGHAVSHARDCGWGEFSNGRLLEAASNAGFDVFITTDQNIRHQQNLPKLSVPVIEINSRDCRFKSLLPFAPFLAEALEKTSRFNFVSVNASGRIETNAPRSEPQ